CSKAARLCWWNSGPAESGWASPTTLAARCSPPKCSTVLCTNASTSSSAVASARRNKAWWPAARRASARSSPSSVLMSDSTTLAPCSANALAVAAPMPSAAAVTSATLPLNCPVMGNLVCCYAVGSVSAGIGGAENFYTGDGPARGNAVDAPGGGPTLADPAVWPRECAVGLMAGGRAGPGHNNNPQGDTQ